MMKQAHFGCGQCNMRRGVGSDAIEHGHPEDAPADNAEDRYQVYKSLCGPELGFFGFAA
jgi:hypothetical protein